MNKEEGYLQAHLEEEGWTVLRRGWPDLFCARETENGREVMLIEVKPYHGSRLKVEQRYLLLAMAEAGIPSYRWSPDLGLEQVTAELVVREGMGKMDKLPSQKRPSEMTREEKLAEMTPAQQKVAFEREKAGLPWW